ncbi:hypothetical protein NADFUDRAFT_49732 [Nadsonia fulvescens var. elongata DSM 6958]|uniref:Uncharacterized protein n=1 Tax=Nadsonia fulvescens var. elongata DSM 6958 TaxID=857566 RepID=A0A1E3PPR8_9ASCO|nr:hypothetical protein NADFUDRAFT_49732 [Nadsonia fulvescens var. elongata DSM 6958]
MLAYGVSADDLFAAFVGSDIVIDLTGQTSDHGEIVDRLSRPRILKFSFPQDSVRTTITSLVAGWALKGPLAFGVDTEHKKTTIIDNGDAPISVSFLSDISKVIASLAVAPFDKLPSRVSIQSDSTTSKEVIDIYESVLGEKLSVESITL